MIRFFNNKTPSSIIDSATLTQEKVAKYVMENGLNNDTGNNYFMCKMNWKHFLAIAIEPSRDTISDAPALLPASRWIPAPRVARRPISSRACRLLGSDPKPVKALTAGCI